MKKQTLLSRFRTWLNDIPIEDPVNRQVTALLQIILIGMVIITIVSTVVNLFLISSDFPLSDLVIQSFLVFLIFTTPVILLRRGYFRISVLIIIAVFIVLVSASIFESNLRAKADSLTFFTIGILLAGLLVGRTALFATFMITAGIVLFFPFNETDPALRLDYIAVAGNFILLNGLMAIFINSFGIALRNALNASLHRENELKAEIAHRKKAEEKVNSLNEQLQKQVAELERFTYTVSHDLRNPLVTIKGFLGMLNRDLQENRPDKIQNDFQRIAGAADKMDALLSDLLELSRIGRIINPPIEIDSLQLIEDAIDNVDARLRSKNAIVNVEPNMPVIYGDRIRLREVFENLIDNAVKYMGDQSLPVIDINVRENDNNILFRVKDNGIGIEESYHNKIFGLFEKLDPTAEGTGIGLALVKRIIETHGGRVWVESDGLGQGSTFCFTIPTKGRD